MDGVYDITSLLTRRTPQGVRGLKLGLAEGMALMAESHPARGAWIEIG